MKVKVEIIINPQVWFIKMLKAELYQLEPRPNNVEDKPKEPPEIIAGRIELLKWVIKQCEDQL